MDVRWHPAPPLHAVCDNSRGREPARLLALMLMMLMMMMLLFVNAANWTRWEQSLPARAGPAFGAASRSYTLIQDDDAYDDDDDDDRKSMER